MLRFAATALTAFCLTSFSAALAGQCPSMAAAIDAKLASVSVSDDVKAQIMDLRDRGMAAHEAGNHSESEALLAEAQALLPN
jgi:hypothetical protein